jgi:hypothetical protein
LTFRRPKLAKVRPPGRRYALADRRTIAAYAEREETKWRLDPALQAGAWRTSEARTASTLASSLAVPPHAAAAAAAASVHAAAAGVTPLIPALLRFPAKNA